MHTDSDNLENLLSGKDGTFKPNKNQPIHRWYPYLEGFSSSFVVGMINEWGPDQLKRLYDPFGGSGTSMRVASELGVFGAYSEINPFMRLVIESKTNGTRAVLPNQVALANYLNDVYETALQSTLGIDEAQSILEMTFPGRPFFAPNRLREICAIREAIYTIEAPENFKLFSKLALASIGVQSSEMKRQGDLRYRTPSEILPDDYSVFDTFSKKVSQIISDISINFSELHEVKLLTPNAVLNFKAKESYDMVITSPPYLNGTNYFRNTKIELWLAGFIEHERELTKFTSEAMIAGINSVSRNSRIPKQFDYVSEKLTELEAVAYDTRIAKMVEGYFYDTFTWLSNCHELMRTGARLVIDIGDSKFAGVHVPVDVYLCRIAREVGFRKIDERLVRVRHSKDGSKLVQLLLVFEKIVDHANAE